MSNEQRQAPRRRLLLSGRAATHDGALSWSVMVRDVSETGARLRAESATLPDRFHLRVPERGIDETVKVVWRRGADVGVSFETSDTADLPELERITLLEREVQALKKMVSRLRDTLHARGILDD